MAGHTVSPGAFKSKDAEPEATLERFSDYCDTMERVFRLRRRIHPTTGERIEFDDVEKKDLLLVEGGEDMLTLFRHVGQVAEGDTYAQAVKKIKDALKKRGNRTSAVFKLFNGHSQGSQTFESWHTEVYKASKLIDWEGYNAETAAVDAIICQTSSAKLQQKALQENPSYLELVDIGISQEQAKKKATKLPEGDSETVSRLKQENKHLKSRLTKKNEGNKKEKCERCVLYWCRKGEECPAIGKKCNKCGGTDHFAASKLCPKKGKTKDEKVDKARRVDDATDSGSGESEEGCGRIIDTTTRIANVEENKSKRKSIYCRLGITSDDDEVFEDKIRFATDTGVRKTIINRSDWGKIRDKCLLVKTKLKFRPYGTDELLPVRGRAKVQLKAKAGATITTYVFVNDSDRDSSLLGKEDAIRLGIVRVNLNGAAVEVNPEGTEAPEEVKRLKMVKLDEVRAERKGEGPSKETAHNMEQIVEEYRDMFGGVGKYKGPAVKIQLKEGVKPVIQPPRRIPLHYVEPLKDHLKELLEEDVIEGPLLEEEEGTWISNLVITDKKWDSAEKKKGERVQIRANLDCRELNEWVYQTHEPIPTAEELRHKLKGSNRFSTLDMVHSFHQFELEEKARKLFTFRAPDGLYRYKRMVMGNNPASSEAHRRVKTVVASCAGVCQIKDDVLVFGKDEEHDERLRMVLTKFKEAGLTLREEKCKLGKPEVKWFGMVYSEHGMSDDPDKVKVIKEWPAPKTVRDVKSFLQTCQFNSVYLAAEKDGEMNYPALTAPLRELTRKRTKFQWTQKHQRHFELIKGRMCSGRVMVPYEVGRETRLYADGGPEGAQATVAQKYDHPKAGVQWRPVAHSSRAWTEAEKRYSQIEKESNALLTGILSNKMYLLGTEFEAAVDHKPLLPLYNTPRRPKQMRVDRHRMKLAGYRFKLVHVPGTETPCDYGTRAGCPRYNKFSEKEKEEFGVEDDDEIYVNRVLEDQLPSAITKDIIRDSTVKDEVLSQVMEDIQKGVCRNSLTRYSKVFEELSVIDGMVVRGEQLVIPRDLQAMVVQLAHEGHMGHEKTLNTLRQDCWFPGMSEMVRKYVESCLPCQASSPRTGQEPLKPTLLPERPWQCAHADFKGPIGQKYYLHTIIDQYSKYPVVDIVASTSWEDMEPVVENTLAMFGNLEVCITDGGPPYNSKNFARYMKRMGIKHHICTAENPQANGFVEVFQKVLVKMIHTAVVEGQDPSQVVQRYLSAYRAAPHKTTGKSPYELMFNRKMMTKLPQLGSFVPKEIDEEVRQKHDKKKEEQKRYADIKRKVQEKDINQGDKVLIQQKKSSLKTPWDPEAYKVKDVQGSKLILERGGKIKERAKNNVKVLKTRPSELEPKGAVRRQKFVEDEDLDLDVDLDKIRVLSAPKEDTLEREVEQGGQEEEQNSHSGPEVEVSSPVRKRLSQQERKRLQSIAKYKRKEEPLRTEMRVKEKWVLKCEGTGTGSRRK